jgi:hypothetical protein
VQSRGDERRSMFHVGLEHTAATEESLASLLRVFEIREAEVKEHGHATTEIPSAEISALLESIGISCSSGELEALCAQLQHIAGHIGTPHLCSCRRTEIPAFSSCPLIPLSCPRHRSPHRLRSLPHHPPAAACQTQFRPRHSLLPTSQVLASHPPDELGFCPFKCKRHQFSQNSNRNTLRMIRRPQSPLPLPCPKVGGQKCPRLRPWRQQTRAVQHTPPLTCR